MRGRYTGESDPLYCINGRDYEITGIDPDFDCFGIIDEVGAFYGISYCYDKEDFEITEQTPFRTDLRQKHLAVYEHVVKEGFVGVRFLRQWGGQDVYELFTPEQAYAVSEKRENPVLVWSDGSVFQKLSKKEHEDFMREYGHYFTDETDGE